jgi:PKD repeat protein
MLVLGALTLVAPRVAAGNWCDNGILTYSPHSGTAGYGVTLSFTFQNLWDDTVQVLAVPVIYGWDGVVSLGSGTIAPWGNFTISGWSELPPTPSTTYVDFEIYGQASADSSPIGCDFNLPFTIAAWTPPVAIASAAPTATDVGLPVVFHCSASGGVAPYTYTWDFGDGVGGGGASPSHDYDATGTMTAVCTVTDSSLTPAQTTAQTSVVVHPRPTVALPDQAAAPGAPIRFAAMVVGGTGGFSYTWSFGDGSSGSGANPTHAYAAPGAYDPEVTATDSVGGTASASGTFIITYLVVSVSVSTTSVTPNVQVVFTGFAVGGAGAPYTFAWDFGDGTTGTGITVSHAYSEPGSYTPRVTVRDALNATNATTISTIKVQSPPAGGLLTSPTAYAVLVIGIGIAAGAAAAIAAAWFVLRRRKAPPAPSEPPRP